jgi:CDP-4-dehydro-6-deoxyglucose reductase, E3
MREAAFTEEVAPDLTLTLHLGGDRVPAAVGDTLLAALRRAATAIRCVCGGRAACGTCRVRIADAWAARLPAPARNEARLLAALPGAAPDHRLACQITLDEGLDGLACDLDSPPTRRTLETVT